MKNSTLLKLSCTALAFALLLACQAQPDSDIKEKSSEAVDIDISTASLHGAYRNAGADTPLILIVPGSGPINRDGNIPGMASNVYKHLADGLAARGISSVRVDKRGMYSSQAAGDPNAVTLDLYAEDYGQWIDYLTSKTGQDCIYLLGHSEGALMVSQTATDRGDVCGLILAAGPGRSMGDVLRTQLKANPANAPILDDAFSAIVALESGQPVDVTSMHPALQGLFAPAVQGFLKSVISIDPVKVLARSRTPALILQGDNDLQIGVEDAELLASAKDTRLVILKDINHVLKAAPRSRGANMAVYNKPDIPVDETLIDAVAEFVRSPQ